MTESELLDRLELVAFDAEKLGFPKTAASLRKLVEERSLKHQNRPSSICGLTAATKIDTLIH